MRRNRQRRNRQGFTLLEILLVAAILVVIGSMATIGYLSMQRGATQRLAMNEIRTMENACIQYKINVGTFPAKLVDLYQQPTGLTKMQWGGPYLTNGDTKDPWGNDYEYVANNQDDRVQISSNGPDGQDGTEDDVSNATNTAT